MCYNIYSGMNKIVRICDTLDEYYGKKEWTQAEPILDELIFTILSQNTTAKNCKEAYAHLRERYPDWNTVRLARTEDIADAIRPAGLANIRARRIKSILGDIYARQGNYDLEWVANLPDKEAADTLLEFPGVGRKTAACVLMFSHGKQILPVDTHVYRVAVRLGLIPEVGEEKAHDLLQEMLPRERIYSFHINMVAHGREICHARKPECYICPINKECDYYAKQTRTVR